MIPRVDWEKLKLFYCVAHHSSFSKAAIKLNTNQSSISRSIIILERQIKSRLFYRSSRGLEITQAGKKWYKIVKNFMLEVEGIKNMEKLQQVEGVFKIASTRGVLDNWLAIIVQKMIEKYPKIQFEFIGHNEDLDLISGEADIAILPAQKKQEDLCYDHIFDRTVGFFASKNYIEKYGEPKTLEDLSQHKIIGASEPFSTSQPFQYYSQIKNEWFDWPLVVGLAEGKIRRPIIIMNSDLAIHNAALQGVGIFAAIREWPSLKHNPDLKLILPEFGTPLSYYYVYPRTVKENPFIRELYNFLKDNQ